MKRFIKFAKVLLMLSVIVAIISSAPYGSILEIPYNYARRLLENVVMPGIGKTGSAGNSLESGEESLPGNFVHNDSHENMQDNQQNGRDGFESGGADYRNDDGSYYIKQDVFQPHDIYSGHNARQYQDVQTNGVTHMPNGEEGVENSGEKELFLTVSEIKSLKSISLADKLKVMTIISKIDKSSIERICHIAGDGITYSEMEEIYAILRKSLKPEHIDELKNIIDRNRKLLIREEVAER